MAGVDSSTQACKVVVRELESGEVVRSGRAAHPDGTEVDPGAWWDALRRATTAAGGLADVEAVSIAGQQHGMVALDADGRVVRDALLWNDNRSADAARALIDELGADALTARTGSVPVASFTVTKLRWLRDHEPQNAMRVAAVALPHDWLSWRLRGYGPRGESELGPDLAALATDRSEASGTGYWSPDSGEYDRELLRAALGHDALLPRVLRPDERAGTVAAAALGAAHAATSVGTAAGAAIVAAGAGDNAAAALGLDARAGDVIVSIGTSGTVYAVTSRAVRDVSGTVAGFADAAGGFLPLIATLNAARVLDVLAGILNVDHDEFGRLALAAPPGAGGLVLHPYFEGERTPNLPGATARLSGMTLASTNREGLARAAIEGMLCGLADGFDAIRAHGIVADRVLLIGGAARNPAVSAIAAQVFDAPIVVPAAREYVAAGAAAQAAWALIGSRPSWPVAITAQQPRDPQPIIRRQYAAAG